MPKRSCFTMIVLSLMTAAGLVGCSAGGGGDGSGSSSGTNDVSAIAGLWEGKMPFGDDRLASYTRIQPTGEVTIYKTYDWFDTGLCWDLEIGRETFTHIRDDVYLSKFVGEEGKVAEYFIELKRNTDGNLIYNFNIPEYSREILDQLESVAPLTGLKAIPSRFSLSELEAQVASDGKCPYSD